MVEITIQVPEALAERIAAVGDRLPEVFARGLEENPPLVSEGCRYVLQFLATNPSPQASIDFHPTPAMQERISKLLEKNRAGELTPAETAELDEYEHIENFLRKLKIRALKDLQAMS
ncbi:MAG: hypothetical protein AB7G75_15550 [Candidatus Binatia bacterium]